MNNLMNLYQKPFDSYKVSIVVSLKFDLSLSEIKNKFYSVINNHSLWLFLLLPEWMSLFSPPKIER